DSVVISAVLTLYVTNNGASDQTATMHELVTPFDDTMDFFEFGDGSGADPLPGQDYVEDPIASIPGPSTGDILELDVTDSIKKIVAGGDYFGWVFVPGGSDGVGIASSEAASNRPKLTVTIEGAAPPTGERAITSGGSAVRGFNAEDVLDVAITITLETGTQDVQIDETLPGGWTASDISDGGALADGVITWNLAGFSGSKTLTYKATVPSDPFSIAVFGATVNYLSDLIDNTSLQMFVPLYKTGNVLAVGVWNESNGSSDLAATADLSDNNGVIYVQDSSAEGGWPSGTIFRWKTVLFDDGFGEEEPGWQLREFANDTEDNFWTEQTDVGFTIGHGGNDGENGETLLATSDETVYTRSIFDAVNYESITEMTLKLEGDDAALAWLNGVYLGYAGAGNSDRGEVPPDFVFDTTTDPDSGGVDANPSDYTQSEAVTIVIPIFLVDAEPVSVSSWSLY
ncbi:MAG: hypothetical protein JXR73_04745, partial [Candidatus Omnitrophica bacterium]|nr:hypothetical protein [Candidatus Omnitrophota bacterium]